MTLEDLRKGNHLFDIEKDLNRFDLSKDNFAVLNKGRLQGSGLSKKVNGIYRKLPADKKFKFLAKFHDVFWEEYEDDLADGDLSYEEMYESLTTLINDIKGSVYECLKYPNARLKIMSMFLILKQLIQMKLKRKCMRT